MEKPFDIDAWEPDDPLLMTDVPGGEFSPALSALQSLLFDDQTPEEIAENFKEQGNECFKKGKQPFLNDAIKFYTSAIQQDVKDAKKRSIYFSNRSAVNLQLGNFGKVIADSDTAISLDPNNVKAYFRAAKASQSLHKYDKAIEYCNAGLAVDPGNVTLRREMEKAQKELIVQEEIKLTDEERAKSVKRLEDAMSSRGIVMGPSLMPGAEKVLHDKGTKVYLDDENSLHWPVIFIIEEYHTVDFIEDFHEDTTFGDHLAVMYPPNEYCDWDARQQYSAPNLEVYAVLNHVPPNKPTPKDKDRNRAKKVKINHNTTLKKVLSHAEYVVPGIPAFYIISNKGNFKSKFLTLPIDALNKES